MRRHDSRLGGRVRVAALIGVLAVLAAGCSTGGPQDVLSPSGPFARKPDQLWNLTFWIAVAVFVVVEGALVAILFRFRHRKNPDAQQFHGNPKLEVLLTAIPTLILAFIAVPTVGTIFDLADTRENAYEIRVIGHQFWWEFQYPEEDFVTANELHIPVGEPIELTIEGALSDRVTNDPQVIHSFWVPRLGGKQDVIPGHENTLFIQADEPGIYFGQCAEFCGLGHAEMKLRVYADAPDDFDSWVADQQESPSRPAGGSLAARGERLFSQGQFAGGLTCAACHAVEATPADVAPNQGPNLAHFASRETFAGATFENNEDNLRAWIADPPEAKQGARMPDLGLTAEEIDAVVAYLQTLR